MGVIDHGEEKLQPAQAKYLKNVYIPYDYWYTVSVERDHHVDFDNVPEKIADILNSCCPDQPEPKMDSDTGLRYLRATSPIFVVRDMPENTLISLAARLLDIIEKRKEPIQVD